MSLLIFQLQVEGLAKKEGKSSFSEMQCPSGKSAGGGWPMFSVPMPCTPVLFPNFTPTSFPLFWQGRSTNLAPNFYCNSAFSTWSSRLQGLGDEDVIGWMNLRCWNVLRNLTFQLRMMMHGCLLKQWLPSWRNTSPIVFCWWKGTKDFQNPTVNLCRFPSSTHHQTKKQGKDPHFGMDKSMFKLQGIL